MNYVWWRAGLLRWEWRSAGLQTTDIMHSMLYVPIPRQFVSVWIYRHKISPGGRHKIPPSPLPPLCRSMISGLPLRSIYGLIASSQLMLCISLEIYTGWPTIKHQWCVYGQWCAEWNTCINTMQSEQEMSSSSLHLMPNKHFSCVCFQVFGEELVDQVKSCHERTHNYGTWKYCCKGLCESKTEQNVTISL